MNTEDHDLLLKVATTVDTIHDRLFGNGQPGEIHSMKRDIVGLQEYRNRLIGGVAVLTLLITVFGGMLLAHILRH